MIDPNEVTDGITAGVEARKQRGLEIAALARIEKKDGFYLVPSQTRPIPTKYKVWSNPSKPVFTCTCADHETRQCNCKHIYAVIYTLRREANPDGSETVTESVTVTKTRKTYAQDWPNYNKAQVHEREHFQTLLRDVCSTIEEPTDAKPRRGRPRVSMADAVFSIVHKVYSTHSGRRFSSELADAKESGLVARAPHYNSCFRYIENPDLFPILVSLIERTAMPLRSVESQFAVDSTGFAFCRFTRWFDIKYNRFTAKQHWVKAHICCGTKTNVVPKFADILLERLFRASQPLIVDTTAPKAVYAKAEIQFACRLPCGLQLTSETGEESLVGLLKGRAQIRGLFVPLDQIKSVGNGGQYLLFGNADTKYPSLSACHVPGREGFELTGGSLADPFENITRRLPATALDNLLLPASASELAAESSAIHKVATINIQNNNKYTWRMQVYPLASAGLTIARNTTTGFAAG
jgi:hypothetical protein